MKKKQDSGVIPAAKMSPDIKSTSKKTLGWNQRRNKKSNKTN